MEGIKICMVLIAIKSLIYSTKSSEIDVKFVIGLPRLNTSNIYDYYFICTATGMMIQWETNDLVLRSFVGQSSPRSFTGTGNNFTYVQMLVLNQASNGLVMFTSVLTVSCPGQCYLDVVCRINESLFDNTTNMNNKEMVQNETKIDTVFLQYLFTENIITAGTSKVLTALICGVQNRFMLWRLNGSDFDVEVAFLESDTVGRVRQQKLQDGSIPVDHLVVLIGNMPYSLVTVLFVIDASDVTATCKYSQNIVNFTIDERGITTTSERMEPSTTSEIHGSEEVSTSTTTKNAFNGSNNETAAGAGGLNILAVVAGPIGAIVTIVIIILVLVVIVLCIYLKHQKKEIIELRNGDEVRKLPDFDDTGYVIGKGTVESQQDIQAVSLTGENLQIMNVKLLEQPDPDCDKVRIILSMANRQVFRVATNIQTAPDGDGQDGTYIGTIGRHIVGIVKHQQARECLHDLETAIRTYFQHAKYVVVVGLCYSLAPIVSIGDVLISNKLLILRTSEGKEGKANEAEKYTVHMNNDIKRIFCEENEDIVVEENHASVRIGKIASGPLAYRSTELREIAKKHNCIGGDSIGEKIVTLQEDGTNVEDKKKFFDIIVIKSVIETVDGVRKRDHLENPHSFAAQAVMCSVIRKIKNYSEHRRPIRRKTIAIISISSKRSEEQRRLDAALKVTSAESSPSDQVNVDGSEQDQTKL